jgi:hypothetical protein
MVVMTMQATTKAATETATQKETPVRMAAVSAVETLLLRKESRRLPWMTWWRRLGQLPLSLLEAES